MGCTLVFDSDCGPCTRFRDVVAFLDPGHRIGYVGLSDAEAAGALSGIPKHLRRRSFHFLSAGGAAFSGSAALAPLAAQLPGGPLTSSAIGSNPVLSRVASFAYETLSRLHDAGSCSVETV